MVESGGRRFIKHINIDVRTIVFCTPGLLENMKKFRYLNPYIDEIRQKMLENESDNKNLPEWEQVTNLGLFRKYAEALLMNHPLIRKDMTIAAYHQQPTEAGIPLELVAYSSEIDWKTYVDMQSEIFEHLFSVIGEFGLKIFQRPTGDDFIGK
jgi:miniconductance mechanosensitive channel